VHYHPRSRTPDYTGLTPAGSADVPADAGHSVLKAWDPVAQRTVWQVQSPGIQNGGTLATAGDLVFEGLADGHVHAYAAQDGRDLWSFNAGVAATGVPITYAVAGKQYVSITVGPPGGLTAAFGSISGRWGWDPRIHPRRLLTFALDAAATLPAVPAPKPAVPLEAPEFKLDAVKAKQGEDEYQRCTLCHGMGVVAGGIAPDLRASQVPLSAEAFAHVVRDGTLAARGMPPFPALTDAQLEALRHFVREKARHDLQAAPAKASAQQ